MNFKAIRQERIATHTRFYRLDVILIQARGTGNAFVAIAVKIGT
jgi:hypothetical protein